MQFSDKRTTNSLDLENGFLLTPPEVAKITRLALSTVRQYIAGGILPVTRLGRRTFVRKSDLLRWIDAQSSYPR